MQQMSNICLVYKDKHGQAKFDKERFIRFVDKYVDKSQKVKKE